MYLMTPATKDEIKANVQNVLDTIGRAADRSGRQRESVKLVAVSKTIAVDTILWALEAGIGRLGENKVQEGQSKKPDLSAYGFEFHLIGPLQKNKVNKAVTTFDWIETVDSFELALRIDRACASMDKVMPVLLQVNLDMEPTKSGVAEDAILELVERTAKLSHLSVRGLMTIPPPEEDPERSRPYFRRLRELAEKISCQSFDNAEMQELSMGMSHDYPVAIEEGATIVRLGTAIFGERQPL
jgi:pyridoxal phosphate enzyme (YggS family)